jgi:hypothetical protein
MQSFQKNAVPSPWRQFHWINAAANLENDQKLLFQSTHQIPNNMTPREQLKKDFGIDFPISGGFGNSREAPMTTPVSSMEFSVVWALGGGLNGACFNSHSWNMTGACLIK